jgi:plastocyanin
MGARRVLVAVALVLGVLAAGCSSNDGGSSGGGDGGASAPAEGGGGSSTSITIKDFAFDPNTLKGSGGQTMTIQLSNEDSTEHSFTLDDGSVSQDVDPGGSASVEVTLPGSGTVGWHCKYHPSTMTGTITIS